MSADEDRWYSFRHALLREVVADDLLPGERTELHLTLARVLERRAAEHGEGAHLAAGIAHHYYAAGEQSAALVASVRAANYGSPSKVVHAREEVNLIVEELNELRAKPWRRGEAKLHCYASVFLFEGEKRVAVFRMRPTERVVEVAQEKGQPGYTIDVEPGALPNLTKLLEEAPPPRCK